MSCSLKSQDFQSWWVSHVRLLCWIHDPAGAKCGAIHAHSCMIWVWIFIPRRVRRKFLASSSPHTTFRGKFIIFRSRIIKNDESLYTFAVLISASDTPNLTMNGIFWNCLSPTESGNLRASFSRLPWGWHSPRQQPPFPCLITGELLPPRYYVFLPWSSRRPWTEVEGLARDERVRQGQWQWQGNSELWWAWSELWQRLFLQCFAKEQCGYQGGWQPRGSLASADVQDRRLRRWGL